MLHGNLKPTQCLSQRYRHFEKQVVSFPRELIMFQLLQNDYHISRFYARLLVAFSSECYFLLVSHSLINLNLQNFAFFRDLLSFTFLASILGIYYFTFSLTLWTGSLRLLYHTRPNLDQANFCPSSAAAMTRLNSISFSTSSFASRTNNILIQL